MKAVEYSGLDARSVMVTAARLYPEAFELIKSELFPDGSSLRPLTPEDCVKEGYLNGQEESEEFFDFVPSDSRRYCCSERRHTPNCTAYCYSEGGKYLGEVWHQPDSSSENVLSVGGALFLYPDTKTVVLIEEGEGVQISVLRFKNSADQRVKEKSDVDAILNVLLEERCYDSVASRKIVFEHYPFISHQRFLEVVLERFSYAFESLELSSKLDWVEFDKLDENVPDYSTRLYRCVDEELCPYLITYQGNWNAYQTRALGFIVSPDGQSLVKLDAVSPDSVIVMCHYEDGVGDV